ncbi:MAG: hypothetical protein HY901_04800 [Deltaproteobacteria bacterium]|nr:hypothetical protein [Deltaproteobacteria bacterium]
MGEKGFFEGRGLASLVASIASRRKKSEARSGRLVELYDDAFGSELLAWLELFDRNELEKARVGDLRFRRPHVDGLKALVTKNQRAEWVAEFQGFFCGVSTIAQDGEMSLMAAWEPSPSGASQVVYAHQDEWGAFHVARSITSLLLDELSKDEKARRKSKLDVERLAVEREAFENARQPRGTRKEGALESFHARTLWLTKAFLGIGGEWSDELAKAATLADWKAEKPSVGRRPNLAAYWLWAHYLLENEEELEEALGSTRHLRSPVVRESREFIETLRAGKKIRLGKLDEVYFAGIREEIGEAAPKPLLGRARAKRSPKTVVSATVKGAEAAATGDLEKAIAGESRGSEALELLKRLETVPPGDTIAWSGLSLGRDESIVRLGELVDARWVGLLAAKLAVAARYRDEHKKATPGLLYALAKACSDFDEWMRWVEAAGTRNFGLRRTGELAQAYACFDHPKAWAWLEEHARRFVDAQIKDVWQRRVPEDVFHACIGTRAPVVPALIARLLEKVELGGQTAGICMAAVARAGELRAPQTLKGVARMVVEGLGFYDLKERAVVARAYARVGGEKARPLLEKTRAAGKGKPYIEMSALSGLLAIPGRKHAAAAQAILDDFRRTKKPAAEQLLALGAVLRGIAADPERSLKALARPFLDIEFAETDATRGWKVGVRDLAAKALD